MKFTQSLAVLSAIALLSSSAAFAQLSDAAVNVTPSVNAVDQQIETSAAKEKAVEAQGAVAEKVAVAPAPEVKKEKHTKKHAKASHSKSKKHAKAHGKSKKHAHKKHHSKHHVKAAHASKHKNS